ncbi:MAG: hypothetical protein GY861_01975, partial [bacterium]|nr:hypothetical protein [bacterium]
MPQGNDSGCNTSEVDEKLPSLDCEEVCEAKRSAKRSEKKRYYAKETECRKGERRCYKPKYEVLHPSAKKRE